MLSLVKLHKKRRLADLDLLTLRIDTIETREENAQNLSKASVLIIDKLGGSSDLRAGVDVNQNVRCLMLFAKNLGGSLRSDIVLQADIVGYR